MNKKYLVMILAALVSVPSFASFKGSISFSAAEKAEHVRGLDTVLTTAAACMESSYAFHTEFFAKYGISPFYGDSSEFATMTTRQKQAHLREYGLPPEILEQMIPSSCVGFAIRCLKKGFDSAGQGHLWAKVMQFTRLNGVDGTAMQTALRALGWTLFYWNPNTAQSAEMDAWEKEAYPGNPKAIWGYHAYRWGTVRKNRVYYNSVVDDISLLVNFGTTPPERFLKAPVFVGSAHGGYHVFPGTFGKVIEGHATYGLGDDRTVESSMFNPIGEIRGPNGNYFSGMIALPPGY